MATKTAAMRIFRHVAGLPDFVRGTSVAIGNFDGVHLGHQAVISEAAAHATELDTSLSVITFEPHPRRFFRPDEAPFQLTPLRSKVRRFQAAGVDNLLVVHFDAETSKLGHEEFLGTFVTGGFQARHVTVGYDFVFGSGRGGDVDFLRSCAARDGFGFSAVEPVKDASGTIYSSTNIRNCLRDGNPLGAARLLGHPWEIEGRVIKGDQRGRQIGFPTANVSLDDYVEPALGVYAVWAGVEEGGVTTWHPGCANVGRRPTFDKDDVNVEVYIFDFTDDIYDKLLRVALVEYIRPEKKFDGIAQLREQIALDSHDARALLDSIGKDDFRRPPEEGRG
ncbi:bifunctional riboflavin kinase/FAD synthetase [uncultured Microbulbifer sp.]|uniref:bifunctional riboflavin kinase/FAD synthetase n=1 Tax=uncultured Microbulbifer sp. TaxID=348147 RepID=UPI0025D7279A|nr:bifunctional riboflavin kinase/FAD synthetase [uncultured Microbulbifer sp.]